MNKRVLAMITNTIKTPSRVLASIPSVFRDDVADQLEPRVPARNSDVKAATVDKHRFKITADVPAAR
jgi:hypothetical protein